MKLEDVEEVLKIINPETNGKKVLLKDLKKKVPFLNPKIPENQIKLLTNNQNSLNSEDLL